MMGDFPVVDMLELNGRLPCRLIPSLFFIPFPECQKKMRNDWTRSSP